MCVHLCVRCAYACTHIIAYMYLYMCMYIFVGTYLAIRTCKCACVLLNESKCLQLPIPKSQSLTHRFPVDSCNPGCTSRGTHVPAVSMVRQSESRHQCQDQVDIHAVRYVWNHTCVCVSADVDIQKSRVCTGNQSTLALHRVYHDYWWFQTCHIENGCGTIRGLHDG